MRWARSIAAAVLVALAVCACGGSGTSSRRAGPDGTSTAAVQGTVTMLQTAFPDSLDPQLGVSPRSAEATWVTYTGLVSYAHRSGPAGATLIPGLARTLPRVSDDGRVYTVTLRRGLVFSDGRAVRASDFRYSLERALALPWPGAAELLDPTVVGAAAFTRGRARSVSGVSVDDRTGTIVIHLTAPDGAFDNVLAEPALGLIPAGHGPFVARSRDPPPGCGPYMIEKVVPGSSYTLARNPKFRPLPGIPAASVNVDVKVSHDVTGDAEAVLNNTADILDWTAPVSVRLMHEIEARAPDRSRLVDTGSVTDDIFLNHSERPFSSERARQAVAVALNRDTLDRLAGGTIAPGCFPLAPAVSGHPEGVSCPYGGLGTGELTRARQLVRRSGMEGQPVLVWSPQQPPIRSLMAAYTHLLRALGFQARLRSVPAATYPTTVGTLALRPQTGWQSVDDAIPSPGAVYSRLLSGHAIAPQDNENLGEVDDVELNRRIATLSRMTPPPAAQWAKLDEDVARRAEVAVIGYEQFPFFASARMDYPSLEINPVYGWDLTSLQLK